ncbi:hypothetical protein H6F32_14065 [Anabaena sp. FACHB-1237]|uniref:hypothetical protein n=1 Tax=Anabaena sp. FACHB-1237 TaxID=2692769 RepID=UPI001680010B|nr:hypothetical protein [Anabaena sp. FACHB-1237]MBD2138685.1 hypothetical protein [Anabaena sp. FACHB-1237]
MSQGYHYNKLGVNNMIDENNNEILDLDDTENEEYEKVTFEYDPDKINIATK